MRVPLTLVLAMIGAGCSAHASDAPPDERLASATVSDGRAMLEPFVPPALPGCAGATAYDLCFAFDHATPLAVHVTLPRPTVAKTVAIVRFVRDGEASTLVADHVAFTVGERDSLDLYFQVYPGAYRIAVGVDLDGDGNPEGPRDALGWSSAAPGDVVTDERDAALVDVGATPIATAFTLALTR
jgi:hypothetical protein